MYFHQNTDDAALVRRCLSGETAAFEGLVEAYQRVAFTVALRMLGDYEDARDATQNTFVKAFEKLHSYDPSRRFFSWIYRILVNECLNARRARRPRGELDELDTAGPAAVTPDAAEAAERRRDVRAALLALPVHYREVIVLRHFAEMSYEDMATSLGLPVNTVKSRLHIARGHLVRHLAAWAVVP